MRVDHGDGAECAHPTCRDPAFAVRASDFAFRASMAKPAGGPHGAMSRGAPIGNSTLHGRARKGHSRPSASAGPGGAKGTHSSMDRTTASGAVDLGSIPGGCAILRSQRRGERRTGPTERAADGFTTIAVETAVCRVQNRGSQFGISGCGGMRGGDHRLASRGSGGIPPRDTSGWRVVTPGRIGTTKT